MLFKDHKKDVLKLNFIHESASFYLSNPILAKNSPWSNKRLSRHPLYISKILIKSSNSNFVDLYDCSSGYGNIWQSNHFQNGWWCVACRILRLILDLNKKGIACNLCNTKLIIIFFLIPTRPPSPSLFMKIIHRWAVCFLLLIVLHINIYIHSTISLPLSLSLSLLTYCTQCILLPHIIIITPHSVPLYKFRLV